MQRLNRSTPAPKGTAFFLFLGLAIVPFSLRAAGLQVSFSPSLSAAADAWQQIADVFGSGYQPAREFGLSIPSDPGGEQLRAFDTAACSRREFACASAVNEFSGTVEDVSQFRAPKAAAVRGAYPKIALCARATSLAAKPTIAAALTKDSLQKQVRALEAMSAVKLETLTHADRLKPEELVKNIERHIGERSLAIPRSFMMLVRVKSPAIPSATRAAQCKVRVALDSVRRVELERAILTSLSSASPDNCEL